MDENANIYRAPEDEIPEADKARLEGYLTAKAEQGEIERQRQKFEEALAKFDAGPTSEGEDGS